MDILFAAAIFVLIILIAGMPFIVRAMADRASLPSADALLPIGCRGCQSAVCRRNPERHIPLVD
jgi:hypothetical protein